MDVSRLTRENTKISPRRHARVMCNRRADYLARIAAAEGDPRLRIAHAADAVRAAGKDLSGPAADLIVQALLGLAGLSEDPDINVAVAGLLDAAGHQATIQEGVSR